MPGRLRSVCCRSLFRSAHKCSTGSARVHRVSCKHTTWGRSCSGTFEIQSRNSSQTGVVSPLLFHVKTRRPCSKLVGAGLACRRNCGIIAWQDNFVGLSRVLSALVLRDPILNGTAYGPLVRAFGCPRCVGLERRVLRSRSSSSGGGLGLSPGRK